MRVAVDPLVADDLPRLHDWLRRPHVAAWWSSPATFDAFIDEYGPLLDEASSTRGWIARLGGRAIAFVQTYLPADDPAWWPDPSPRNADAIGCFRRAGFVPEREVVTPDGPALLLIRSRP
jgi:hypothetical protein